MRMTVLKEIFLFLCLLPLMKGNFNLGTCSLQCKKGSDDSWSITSTGLKGPKGEKGDSGEPCRCSEVYASSFRLAALQRSLGQILLKQKKFDELEIRLQKLEHALEERVERLKGQVDHLQNASEEETTIFRSCKDVQTRNDTKVYTLSSFNGNVVPMLAVCDRTTDGGGWLVVQKREDGSANFFRGWDDYVNGFGTLTGEFWIGLEVLHTLTRQARYELRFDMEDFNNRTAFAKYENFAVGYGPEYILTVSGYSGTAGKCVAIQISL